jgi:hypothetical protein
VAAAGAPIGDHPYRSKNAIAISEMGRHAPGDRLARSRNVLAASYTTELAARFGRGPLLGGYLNP